MSKPVIARSAVGKRDRINRSRRKQLDTPEALEQRLCMSGWNLSLVAKSGDPIGSDDKLQNPTTTTSINDQGRVAFTGTYQTGGVEIFVSNPSTIGIQEGQFSRLAGLPSIVSNKDSYLGAQINNNNQVVTRKSENLSNVTTTTVQIINADHSSLPKDIRSASGADTVDAFPSINNQGDVAISGNSNSIVKGSTTLSTNYIQVARSSDLFRADVASFSTPSNARTEISDNDRVVARTPDSSIVIYLPIAVPGTPVLNFQPLKIANSPYFNNVGSMPGISNDGKTVAFYGELTAQGVQLLNGRQQSLGLPSLSVGPGIFASYSVNGLWVVQRLAALSDTNAGSLAKFDPNERVGVSNDDLSGKIEFSFAAYNATGGKGIYTLTLDAVSHVVGNFSPVVSTGNSIVGLTGIVSDLNLSNSVNNNGQLAFWVKTDKNMTGVVRADPNALSVQLYLTDVQGNRIDSPLMNQKYQVFAHITNNDPTKSASFLIHYQESEPANPAPKVLLHEEGSLLNGTVSPNELTIQPNSTIDVGLGGGISRSWDWIPAQGTTVDDFRNALAGVLTEIKDRGVYYLKGLATGKLTADFVKKSFDFTTITNDINKWVGGGKLKLLGTSNLATYAGIASDNLLLYGYQTSTTHGVVYSVELDHNGTALTSGDKTVTLAVSKTKQALLASSRAADASSQYFASAAGGHISTAIATAALFALTGVGLALEPAPGVLLTTAAAELAIAGASTVVSHYAYQGAVDPPDSNYKVIVTPQPDTFYDTADLPNNNWRDLVNTSLQAAAVVTAEETSRDRAVGAANDGATDWQVQQLVAAANYAQQASVLVQHESDLLSPVRQEITADPAFDGRATATVLQSQSIAQAAAAASDFATAIALRTGTLKQNVTPIDPASLQDLNTRQAAIQARLTSQPTDPTIVGLVQSYLSKSLTLLDQTNNLPALQANFDFGQQALQQVQQADANIQDASPSLAAIADQTVIEGQTVTFQAQATDPDPTRVLTYTLAAGSPTGSTIDPKTGQFSWITPAQTGVYHAMVLVTDNTTPALSDERDVTINVFKKPPTVSAGSDSTVAKGVSFTRNGSFSDPLATSGWTASADYGDGSSAQTLTLNPDHSFLISHVYATAGTFTTTVSVTDSQGGVGSASYIVSVSAGGVVAHDFTATTGQDVPMKFPVLTGDTDDSGTIDLSSLTLITVASHGTAVANSDGTVNYTPASGYVGGDGFTFQVKDNHGNLSNVAKATLTVTASQSPVAVADAYSVASGKSLTVSATSGVLANDSDPSGRALTAVQVDGPAHGSLKLNADGSFVYTPVSGFSGTDTFHYMANDGLASSGVVPVTLAVVAAPQVASVVYGDGSSQRSMVSKITVAFNGVVTLQPGAVEVDHKSGGAVGVNLATSLVGGKTVATLTFSGSDIVGGSLGDGSYNLVLHDSLIQDGLGNRLDDQAHGMSPGNYVDAFFRLFGDANGDGVVDNLDYYQIRSAFGKSNGTAGYLASLDYDGNGVIDRATDLAQFTKRFGKRVTS